MSGRQKILIFAGISIGLCLILWVVNIAELPSRLDKFENDEISRPAVIKVMEPVTSPVPEPPAPAADDNLLASLRPDSLANSAVDLGLGVGFGSGGGGPAIGGSGGFGDTQQMVQQATASDRPVRVALKAPLEFPAEARQRGVSGFVVLKILVSNSGAVEKVEIQESHPAGVFDSAAIQAIRSWRFEPALEKGRTVAALTLQRIRFELN